MKKLSSPSSSATKKKVAFNFNDLTKQLNKNSLAEIKRSKPGMSLSNERQSIDITSNYGLVFAKLFYYIFCSIYLEDPKDFTIDDEGQRSEHNLQCIINELSQRSGDRSLLSITGNDVTSGDKRAIDQLLSAFQSEINDPSSLDMFDEIKEYINYVEGLILRSSSPATTSFSPTKPSWPNITIAPTKINRHDTLNSISPDRLNPKQPFHTGVPQEGIWSLSPEKISPISSPERKGLIDSDRRDSQLSVESWTFPWESPRLDNIQRENPIDKTRQGRSPVVVNILCDEVRTDYSNNDDDRNSVGTLQSPSRTAHSIKQNINEERSYALPDDNFELQEACQINLDPRMVDFKYPHVNEPRVDRKLFARGALPAREIQAPGQHQHQQFNKLGLNHRKDTTINRVEEIPEYSTTSSSYHNLFNGNRKSASQLPFTGDYVCNIRVDDSPFQASPPKHKCDSQRNKKRTSKEQKIVQSAFPDYDAQFHGNVELIQVPAPRLVAAGRPQSASSFSTMDTSNRKLPINNLRTRNPSISSTFKCKDSLLHKHSKSRPSTQLPDYNSILGGRVNVAITKPLSASAPASQRVNIEQRFADMSLSTDTTIHQQFPLISGINNYQSMTTSTGTADTRNRGPKSSKRHFEADSKPSQVPIDTSLIVSILHIKPEMIPVPKCHSTVTLPLERSNRDFQCSPLFGQATPKCFPMQLTFKPKFQSMQISDRQKLINVRAELFDILTVYASVQWIDVCSFTRYMARSSPKLLQSQPIVRMNFHNGFYYPYKCRCELSPSDELCCQSCISDSDRSKVKKLSGFQAINYCPPSRAATYHYVAPLELLYIKDKIPVDFIISVEQQNSFCLCHSNELMSEDQSLVDQSACSILSYLERRLRALVSVRKIMTIRYCHNNNNNLSPGEAVSTSGLHPVSSNTKRMMCRYGACEIHVGVTDPSSGDIVSTVLHSKLLSKELPTKAKLNSRLKSFLESHGRHRNSEMKTNATGSFALESLGSLDSETYHSPEGSRILSLLEFNDEIAVVAPSIDILAQECRFNSAFARGDTVAVNHHVSIVNGAKYKERFGLLGTVKRINMHDKSLVVVLKYETDEVVVPEASCVTVEPPISNDLAKLNIPPSLDLLLILSTEIDVPLNVLWRKDATDEDDVSNGKILLSRRSLYRKLKSICQLVEKSRGRNAKKRSPVEAFDLSSEGDSVKRPHVFAHPLSGNLDLVDLQQAYSEEVLDWIFLQPSLIEVQERRILANVSELYYTSRQMGYNDKAIQQFNCQKNS